MSFQTIPILRIFNEQKALDFYCNYLGMQVDWKHRFEEDLPLYMQVSKDNLVFHLTEHHGDCAPNAKVFVRVENIEQLFQELKSKDYAFCNPALEAAPWGDTCFTVTDPFSNRILFNQA